MARISAQLLLLIGSMMGSAASGCLLPPDGNGVELLGPYPPQVDLLRIFPRKPLLEFDLMMAFDPNPGPMDCPSIRLEVTDIVDQDSEQLLFRWVANNDLESTLLLDEETSLRNPGEPITESENISHLGAFRNVVSGDVRFISLFITDAAAWADPEPELDGQSAADLGRIPDDPNASVVEVRWTFRYIQGSGSCDE